MKAAVIDLETTTLEAIGAGILLCVGIRPLDTDRIRQWRLDQYEYEPDDNFGYFDRQEVDLLNDTIKELNKYDLLIGHNIDGFDIPYLRSRAYQHKINWWTHPLTYDTYKGFRRTGFLSRQNGFGKPIASMDMVADFLGLAQLKTKIYPREWWLTIWGDKSQRLVAMNEVVDHNERDVRLNAQMYPILLQNDPKVNIKRLP